MLVYGDRSRIEEPKALVAGLAEASARLSAAGPGLERHSAAVTALIEAGGLAQGLADHAFEQRGCDGADPGADLAMAAAHGFGRVVAASWRTGFAQWTPPPTTLVAALETASLPSRIEVRSCEGFAHYAVYPELYAEAAAKAFPRRPPRVIGIRSIGSSLAAAAAAGAGAPPPLTVRPVGEPFDRALALDSAFAARAAGPSAGGYAVVDEGPGQSGSSFAAVGAFLETAGADPARIVYMPSHPGEPGPAAPESRRRRWREARRAHADFDLAIAPRLAAWAEPMLRPSLGPVRDLSAGGWRAFRAADAPAWPEGERRKLLIETRKGSFLLKFAGLSREGEAKLARAKALHAAGFTAEPLGLVHGFLAERWLAEARPLDLEATGRPRFLSRLGDYLAFRARRLSAGPGTGAKLAELKTMIRRNLGLAGLDATAGEAAAEGLDDRMLTPVEIDGRLHAWEWLVLPDGRILKADALDHCVAHDLIGCQDIAWDVAGAQVEFALTPEETARLAARVGGEAGRPVDPRALAFMRTAYLAFQLGWWRTAAQGCEGARAGAQARRYEEILRCGTARL